MFRPLVLFVLFGSVASVSSYALDTVQRSGPVKAYEIFPGFFPQVEDLLPRQFHLKNYFRRFSLFSQFSTLAVFDVVPVCGKFFNHYHTLRLTSQGYDMKEVRKYLLDMKKELTALSKVEVQIFLFADLKVGNDVGLEARKSPWNIRLNVGDEYISPTSIEPVKKDEALEVALNPWYDRFKLKKIYKLTFSLPLDFQELSDVSKEAIKRLNSKKTNINNKYNVSSGLRGARLFAGYLGLQGATDLPKLEGHKVELR